MLPTAQESYLATHVQTATSAKLQLMLLEWARRFGQTAKQMWAEDHKEQAREAIGRCHDIVGELLASVASGESEISKNLTRVYLYLFRTLGELRLVYDDKKIDGALSVLDVERETWMQVCAKLSSDQSTPGSSKPSDAVPREDTGSASPKGMGHTPGERVSFEA